ncbi:ATP-binding cassette domain-containing protein [Sediminibacterium sp.]|uniref:ATP-binding cassette domain-containing protein n=1 Tax=Sediminibacterium sp. TaxID=1917865 RepID=UPI0025D3EAA7|nr:ATP-binding cassette domain-containing protein [Sediminibacterium sp.]MDO8995647.1 ATP-binding cassette domain-containing protein [Sediminibacterium sp.]MDP2421821.1 ATP-binding cassette domain-containing protein [Sediminibacterium sp.]
MIQQLEADGIQLQFDNRVILSDVYLSCAKGSIIGLLGRNGSGKSCLLQVIFGSLSCEKSIRINRVSFNEAYKNQSLISYLPQFHFIPNSLSLKDIFEVYALDYSIFELQFPSFHIPINQTFKNLSGGEKRLIEIYIIVESTTQFALLDEPFTFLNPIQIEAVKSYIKSKTKTKGFIITDHLYKHILDISDTNYVLANGKTHLIKQFSEFERLGYISIENS